MAKKYTLIAEQHFSGNKPIKIGDEIEDLTALQVSRFLKNGSGKFKTKDELKAFNKEFESEIMKKEKAEAQAKAILEKEILTNDLTASYTDVVGKEAALLGVVYSEKETLGKVEELLKRVEVA